MMLDVIFAIHNTQKISVQNWHYTKQFLMDLYNGITTYNAQNRIAALEYSETTTQLWDLESKCII